MWVKGRVHFNIFIHLQKLKGIITMREPITDEEAMALALEQAKRAQDAGDVPVGAVVLQEGQVIAAAANRREADGDPTAHAEIVALREAAAHLGRWRLSDCTLVVTLEPCFMCAGAVVNARIGRVVFGALDPKGGALSSLAQVGSDPRLNHQLEITPKICEDQCSRILRDFFQRRRAEKRAAREAPNHHGE